jgi:hypothetical protein
MTFTLPGATSRQSGISPLPELNGLGNIQIYKVWTINIILYFLNIHYTAK